MKALLHYLIFAGVLVPSTAMTEVAMGTLQMLCVSKSVEDFSDQFRESHGEVSIGRGITHSEDAMFHLLVNEKTRTWTVLAHDGTRNLTCVVSNGGDWQTSLPDEKPRHTEPGVDSTTIHGTDL